jgi:hypothetical protein
MVVKVLSPEVGRVVCPEIVDPDEVGACVVREVPGRVVAAPLHAKVTKEKKRIETKIKLLLNNWVIEILLFYKCKNLCH